MAFEKDQSLLTIQQVCQVTGLGLRTIHAWYKTGEHRFPKPIKLGRLLRWRSGDIQNWISQGVSMSNAEGK